MGTNPELIGAAILSLRLLLHVVTALSLALYINHKRSKWWVTALAILGAGCSMAAFFQGVGEFHTTAPRTQPWVMGIVFVLTASCLLGGGDPVRGFRKLWTRGESA
jgi:hypothetical protein